MRVLLFLSLGLILLQFDTARSQQREQIKREAESKLQQMTPQQIEAKIKELGMTHEQAEARAKELGIDLNTYLRLHSTPSGPLTPEAAKQLSPETRPDIPTQEQLQKSETAKPEGEKAEPTPQTIEEIKGKAAMTGPGGLPHFGYDVFRAVPPGFEPTAVGPVDPEYLIGPEDVLRVTVWGQAEFENELVVDKEGRVFIPTVGPVLVSGLTLEKAYAKLLRQMSRSYSGLVAQPPTVWLDVTLARLRPKRIFIMGEVDHPGGYTVSSYANVFSSLFSVGGPTLRGSMRDVRVIRGGRIIARVDLYDYLIGAEKTNDMRVQNNDIIYVPPRGKTVSIAGEVRRPAIFELKEGEQFKSLLSFAGGLKSTAYIERMQVDRVVPFDQRARGDRERRIIDANLREVVVEGKDYPLFDQDAIQIYSVLDVRLNFVTVKGSVVRPGTYQLEKVPTIRQLVLEADSLRPDAYLDRAEIFRTRPDSTYEVIRINLAKAMAGDSQENAALMPLDEVRIYSIHEIEDRRFVTIRGHVKNPGKYVYADSLTLYDLVFKAGGLTDSLYRAQTFLQRADLIRLNPDGITKRTIPFHLGNLLDGDPSVNRPLLPEDEVVIYEIDVAKLREKFVEVRGKVRAPGRFPLTTNMTLTDAILLAGGYSEDAWMLEAEIARVERTGMGQDTLTYIRLSKLPDLEHTNPENTLIDEEYRNKSFRLQHRDYIYVRKNPEYKEQNVVILQGEVQFPGEYALKVRNERLSDLIRRAGGLTKSAYLHGGRITRSGKQLFVDFQRAVTLADPKHDVILHPGDLIVIPEKPNAVVVNGEVANPGIFGFVNGDNMWDYIDKSGGVSDSAYYALVTSPNGFVERYSLGFFGGNPKIEDGSMITIVRKPPPPPEEKVDIAGTIKDTFAILSSAATLVFIVWQVTK